jgi:hypothetical protein
VNLGKSVHEKIQDVERALARHEETRRPRDARTHGTMVPSPETIQRRVERELPDLTISNS